MEKPEAPVVGRDAPDIQCEHLRATAKPLRHTGNGWSMGKKKTPVKPGPKLERETGLEPATFSLGS